MKAILALAIAVVAWSPFADASFAQVRCSNADGSVQMKHDFPPADDGIITRWIINGVVIPEAYQQMEDGSTVPTIEEKRLTKARILESKNYEMAGSSVYTYKSEVAYSNGDKPQKVTTRLICQSFSGI